MNILLLLLGIVNHTTYRTRLAQVFKFFFAYFCLIIKFRGVVMKLKKNCPCNFRGIIYFYDFYQRLTVNYKPSNFARANKPYAMG